jgi:hypothetical protein
VRRSEKEQNTISLQHLYEKPIILSPSLRKTNQQFKVGQWLILAADACVALLGRLQSEEGDRSMGVTHKQH